MEYCEEQEGLTEERVKAIKRAILDSKKYKYDLGPACFSFVKQFYETDFQKSIPRAPKETRILIWPRYLDWQKYQVRNSWLHSFLEDFGSDIMNSPKEVCDGQQKIYAPDQWPG